MNYYIASCVFTRAYPTLSFKIQNYVRARGGVEIVRCCVPKYKLNEFTEQMPPERRDGWSELPDSADFQPDDTVWSLCHNCSAIIEEQKPGVNVRSLWKLILEDDDFAYPDMNGREMFVQDCWRARDRADEQAAVRGILRRMNVRVLELDERGEKTEFCGVSLLRPPPPRNLKMAPKRFVENAPGKFLPHSPEEQRRIMTEYAARFAGKEVADYCHYCHEGLLMGGAKAFHLAELLFGARLP
ncbi:MAG: hypothetical protein IJ233_05575 [Pyramidobacter sp.]|nr:hypothetical protein [Pyramidobacter sp.]